VVPLVFDFIEMFQQSQPDFALGIHLQLHDSLSNLQPALPSLEEKASDDFLLQSSGIIIVRRFQRSKVPIKPPVEDLEPDLALHTAGHLSLFGG